uniref:Uncharacterized protein n=1 Tax=Zea mays TaxID=4577 RepID=A0A804N0L5_MAIZE
MAPLSVDTGTQFLQVAAHLVRRSSQVHTPDQLVHSPHQHCFFVVGPARSSMMRTCFISSHPAHIYIREDELYTNELAASNQASSQLDEISASTTYLQVLWPRPQRPEGPGELGSPTECCSSSSRPLALPPLAADLYYKNASFEFVTAEMRSTRN